MALITYASSLVLFLGHPENVLNPMNPSANTHRRHCFLHDRHTICHCLVCLLVCLLSARSFLSHHATRSQRLKRPSSSSYASRLGDNYPLTISNAPSSSVFSLAGGESFISSLLNRPHLSRTLCLETAAQRSCPFCPVLLPSLPPPGLQSPDSRLLSWKAWHVCRTQLGPVPQKPCFCRRCRVVVLRSYRSVWDAHWCGIPAEWRRRHRRLREVMKCRGVSV